MINKHTLLNNKLITNSVNLIKDVRPKTRALVTSGSLSHDPANGRLSDFFDVVIAENLEARNKLGFADIVFYTDPSAYRDGIFALDPISELDDTIIMMNFSATKDLVKLKRDLGIFNLNYIPSNCNCTPTPGGPLQNELNANALGIHTALALGCTTIYSDTTNTNSDLMTSEQLRVFLTTKKTIRPMNILSVGRTPLLKAAF